MSVIIAQVIANSILHPESVYKVSTPVFEGPLDLLLQLIERAELDITHLALAQVTDQFLAHLKLLEDRTPEEVSDFLVVAARLLQIKSEALLPRPPIREASEEDPAEALAMQLIAYKRFRQIADLLSEREKAGLRTYLRLAPPPEVEASIDFTGIELSDLVSMAEKAFLLARQRQSIDIVVKPPRITIREKIQHIAKILGQRKNVNFSTLVMNFHSRLDVVITFLALLELVKRNFVFARQDELFGEINLESGQDWQGDSSFEIEFSE